MTAAFCNFRAEPDSHRADTVKAKILYVIDNRAFRGGERLFAHLAANLDPARFTPLVAARPGGLLARRLQAHDIPLHPVEVGSRYRLGAVGQLLRLVRAEGVDIVHTQGAGGDFFGRLAGWLARKPVISTMSILVDSGLSARPGLKKRLTIAADRFTGRLVTRFTAHSEAVRHRLIESHGLAPERVLTIHNGIDPAHFNPALIPPGQLRAELGLGPDVPLVGSIGHLDRQKGLTYLLQAAVHVSQAHFVLVGQGPQRTELEQLAHALGLGRRCHFSGFRPDVRPLLADLDVFVLSSIMEGLPLALLEAMAMQRPIVATALPGVAEAITSPQMGRLVPPREPVALAEAITALLQERPLARQARRRVARCFNARQMVQKYQHLYLEVGRQNP